MSADTMKAWRFAKFGPPSVLRIEGVAIPEPGEEDLRAKVLDLTAGKGVDVVFDTVGGSMFEPALRSLSYSGRW